jgi:glycosyltransferase involved in cell wall biosynthesis
MRRRAGTVKATRAPADAACAGAGACAAPASNGLLSPTAAHALISPVPVPTAIGNGREGVRRGPRPAGATAALLTTRMTILHIGAPAEVGGLERVLVALASGLQRRGHRVAVAAIVTPGPREPPLLTALRDSGVEPHALAVPDRRYLRERASVRSLCHTLRPDVVHTHGYRPDVVDAGVARGLGVPIVTTVHGFTGRDWKGRLYERLQVRAYRRFDAVVAVSRPQVDFLVRRGVRPERVHLVRNAWMGGGPLLSRDAARRTLGLPAAGFQIGWLGRFSPEKGPDVLVHAMALLADLPVSAAMVGGGSGLAATRALATRLGADPHITWPGQVADAAALLRAFDLVVLSSRSEGTPIVLFEAMAAGVPVVASRVGGVPDVVGDNEAVLVPAADPAALAAAVRAVLADPGAARTRADAARRRLASAFALDPWLQQYEAVYGTARSVAAEAHR